MDKSELRERFDQDWTPWVSALLEVDPETKREPGVCGDWTLHDVVAHVHSYLRYYLAQVRAAFDHAEATDEEINGERDPMPQGTPNTLEARNTALREGALRMTWRQLLDESVWLRERAFAFIDARTEGELDVEVGWVPFWDPDFPKPDDLQIHVRRVAEAPAAEHPTPAGRFILPDHGDAHVSEHLGQIRSWLEARTAAAR